MYSNTHGTVLQGASDIDLVPDSPHHSGPGFAGRGKGKGGTSALSAGQFEPAVLQGSHTPREDGGGHSPSNSVAGGFDPISVLPTDNFAISVCSKGCKPTPVQVRSGTTVGQLSQAEEGFSSFAQPIAVTTLTGFPFPLNSKLTPSTWYVIANGATHTTPKCPEVHACQSTVLTLQGQSRFQGLLVQGPLVAVDEMQFYVRCLIHLNSKISQTVTSRLQAGRSSPCVAMISTIL